MSTLQDQVNLLRQKNVAAAQPVHRGRASLFLTPAEAAGVDLATVLDAASNGLMALNQYDGRFGVFMEGLLHPSSVSTQRELKTKEENTALDKEIRKLLSLLSLFISELPAHKVLEYLVQRFRIHELNGDAFLSCLLPIHDSKIFGRAVQLATLGDVWSFLDGVKRTGTPLPRSVLVKKIQRNVNLLATLCKILKSAVKLAGADGVRANSPITTGATKILSFFTACMIEFAQDMPLEDEHVRQIYPVLIDGLRSTAKAFESSAASGDSVISLQWLKSSCMIIAQVSRRTKFAKPFLKSLLSVMSRAFVHTASNAKIDNDSGGLELVMTLAILSQPQTLNFDGPTIHAFVFDVAEVDASSDQNSYFLEILRQVNTTMDATDLITAFISGVVDCLTYTRGAQDSISTSKASSLLSYMVGTGLIRQDGLRLVIEKIISSGTGDDDSSSHKFSVIRKIAERYPNLFDGCIQHLMQAAQTSTYEMGESGIRDFLSLAFVDAPYHIPLNEGTGLLLSLRNSSAQVRIQALQYFASSIPLDTPATRDIVGLAEASLHCLTDADSEVARLAWSTPVLLCTATYVEHSLLLEALVNSFDFWLDSSMRELRLGCSMLCTVFESLSDPSILAALALSSNQPTRDWIVRTIISNSLGLVSSIAPVSINENESTQLCKEVENAAMKCAKSARAFLPVFEHLQATTSEPLTDLGDSLLKHLRIDTQSALELITTLANGAAHDSLNKSGQSVVSKRSTQSIVRLLCLVSGKLSKEHNPDLLSNMLHLVVPLILQMLYVAVGVTDECKASMNFAADLFATLLHQLKSTEGVAVTSMNGVKTNVKELLEALAANRIETDDFRMATLRGLLSLPDVAVAPLIGQFLATFFLDHPLFVLLQVAIDTTEVRARSGAMYAISAFLGSAAPKGLDAKEYSSMLLLISLLTSAACCDEEQSVRRSGLAVANKLSQLNDKLALSSDSKGSSFFGPALSTCTLSVLGTILSKTSSTIALDPSVASATLASQLFARRGDEALESLQNVMLATLSIAAWHMPGAAAPVMDSASAMPVDVSIKFTRHLFNSPSQQPQRQSNNSGASLLSQALVNSINSIRGATPATQKEICALLCKIISDDSQNVVRDCLRDEALKSLGRGWAESLSSVADKTSLFEALVEEQLRAPGRTHVLESLKRVSVSGATLVSLLQKMAQDLALATGNLGAPNDHDPSATSGDGNRMQVDFEDASISGMSVQLQRMCSFLEAVSPIISALANDNAGHLSSILLILMETFTHTNLPGLRAILSIEYCNSLLMDLAHSCLAKGGADILAEGQRAGKAQTKYAKPRLAGDVSAILKCLGKARTSQLQSSALLLVQDLISLDGSAITACVNSLGDLLSSSVGLWQGQDGLGKEDLSKKILRMLVTVMSPSASAGNGELILAQQVLQPLCVNLGSMQSHRTSSLLKMALNVLGDSSLPVCVCILLTHAFCSYQLEDKEAAAVASGKVTNGETFILLSRSAERKAFRTMKTSQPEELLSLAVDLTTARPAIAQVANLVSMVKITHQYLEIVNSSSTTGNVELEAIAVALPGASPLSIDTKKLHEYYETILKRKGGDQQLVTRAETRGAAAAVTMLYLEFLHEAVESRNFHRALVQLVDAPNSDFKIQEHFVELSDHLLQLLALATTVQQGSNSSSASKKKQANILSVRFGNSVEEISTKVFGKCVSNWCLDILKSLQRLLDAPTFVSILQELIDHEQPSVRQVALQILCQRLEKMSPSKRSSGHEEKVLLLDLSTHLRRVVQEAIPTKKSDKTNRASVIGLAQSAIMCIDILASFFGKSREWAPSLSDSLTEMVAFSTSIVQLTKQGNNGALAHAHAHAYGDELKLLAATFLALGTLIKSVGVAALPLLPTILSNLLSILESHGADLSSNDAMDDDDDDNDDNEDLEGHEKNPVRALRRTRILLIRSTITSIGAVCGEMYAFSHPYLQRILSATLALHDVSSCSVKDQKLVVADIDRCLSLLACKIPPRLSSPALLQAAPHILSSGHNVARRFAQLLSETYNNLDRNAVLAHMGDLSEMASLVLDYRGVHGDKSEESSATEKLFIETVVVLCLKLTETEMKQLLGRLGEWRDSNDGAARSRCVTFYLLLAALGQRLKGIFVPCAAPFWAFGLSLLGKLASGATAATDGSSRSSKSKKRRRLSESAARADVDDDDDNAEGDSNHLLEGAHIAVAVLEFVRVICLFDDCDFVDEARYLASIASVGALISVRAAFPDDSQYLDFTEHSLTPCIIGLAQCAKRDTLWKPLIHHLLMSSRNSKSVVRLASLRAVHNLFIKIGEEFLLLLPECLPFLSELLEDDNTEVSDLAGVVIRYIEELSGETLDSYL